jgi:hypothetical protein
MSVQSTLISLGLGAGAMYFYDPELGRRRRVALRDQFVGLANDLNRGVNIAVTDARKRAEGVWHEAQSLASTPEQLSDERLHARIRAELGRRTEHPRAVHVEVHDRHVTLRGPILAHEVEEAVEAVRSMAGVEEVDNQLEVHTDVSGISALQGEGQTGPDRTAITEWTPSGRLAAVGLGSLAMLACWIRPTPANVLLGTLGFGALVAAAADRTTHTTPRSIAYSP